MPRLVQPVGPKDADIVIIGEAPGSQEVAQGEPFVGEAGELLNTLLRMSRIRRSKCWITNISKERPPRNNFKRRFYEEGKPNTDLLHWYEVLEDELSQLDPNVIVPVGNEAFKFLADQTGITNWRGSILDTDYGKAIPTIHPAFILHGGTKQWGKYFPLMLADWQKIARESKFPENREPEYTLITDPALHEVEEAYHKIKQADHLSFDIETIRPEIDCLGLSCSENWAICIPFCYSNGEHYWKHARTERQVWEMVADLLWDRSIGKIAQNANYDIAYLERHGCPTRNLYMDTMNAFHCLYPEILKRLEVLTSIYTGLPFYKDKSNFSHWEYNALDALATYRVAMGIVEDYKDMDLDDVAPLKKANVGKHFYFDYWRRLGNRYREVSNRGIKIDLDKREKFEEEYQEKFNTAEEELQEVAKEIGFHADKAPERGYDHVNPNSPQQLMDMLYGEDREGGLSPRVYTNYDYKKKESKPTTDEEALTRMNRLGKTKNKPLLAKATGALLRSREYSKILGTYAKVKYDPDGRVRCNYRLAKTVTLRLASSESLVTESGTNLQNQPEVAREMYIPDSKNKVFVEGDFSGADAMVLAYVSGDPNMINVFDSGQDYHAVNTAMIFQLDVPDSSFIRKSDVPKDLRQESKAVSHGANYGRGYKAIALQLGISEPEGKKRFQRYFNMYPGIPRWHDEIEQTLKTTGVLVTPIGSKRTFFGSLNIQYGGRIDSNVLRSAYSHIPQSTVGHITHIGFLRMADWAEGKSWVRPVLNMHDSVVMETEKSAVPEVSAVMKEKMHTPLTWEGREFAVPVDIAVGRNWKELKIEAETLDKLHEVVK